VFNRNRRDESHPLDDVIEHLTSALEGLDDGSENHTRAVESLKTLYELRAADKAGKKFSVNSDVITAGAMQLVGIFAILGFEKANVITTKAMGFVPKVKS